MRVSRTAWLDWYVDDAGGESAVFVDGRVLVMSELATTLLDLVAAPRDIADLATALSGLYGPPEGDEVAVTSALVDDLVAEGVLAVDARPDAEVD